jgi:hypothetical protein
MRLCSLEQWMPIDMGVDGGWKNSVLVGCEA